MGLVSYIRRKKLAKRIAQESNDLDDRRVQQVRATFKTIHDEEVSFTSWVMLDKLLNGLKSYQELTLLDRSKTVKGKTYNTKNIVSIEAEIIDEGFVKPEVKREMDGYDGGMWSAWEFRRYFTEDELE